MNDLESPSIPSYLIAADTHTLANNNYSLLDSLTLGTEAVVGSALTQTFNILPTVGNLLGGDFELAKTKDVLQSFDDDVGKYYESHQEGVDALGFALSSIVPGIGGVKVFNAGQRILRGAVESGAVGGNMGKALGLLAPSEPKLLTQAIQTALQPNAGFPVWNANTIKAIAAGVGQSAMEGAAFETAVAVTMSQSPILEKQDFSDITSNILSSAALFGAIGGVANTASVFHKIKSAGRALDAEATPWTHVATANSRATPADKILTLMEDAAITPEIDAAKYVGEDAWKAGKFQSLREDKLRYIDTEVRRHVGELTGGDQALADDLFSSLKSVPFEQVEAKLFGTTETGRLGKRLAAESVNAKSVKLIGLEDSVEDILSATPPFKIQYIKLAGEDAGKITNVKPEALNIADGLIKGEEYSKVVGSYKQVLSTAFDPLKASPMQAEARYVTALKMELAEGTKIGENDLPYLQAAYLKGKARDIKVVTSEGTREFQAQDELYQYLIERKQAVASKLLASDNSFSSVAKITDQAESVLAGGTVAAEAEKSFILTTKPEQWARPQWIKQALSTEPIVGVNGNVLEGMVAIKQQQKLYEQAADRAIATVLGEDTEKFSRISDTLIMKATRNGPGGGMLSSQNENYGSLGSAVQNLGAQALQRIQKVHNEFKDAFSSVGYKLAQKQEAVIEWSVLNGKLRQYGEAFGYDAEQQAMRPFKLIEYERALQAGQSVEMPLIDDGIPLMIPVKHSETVDMINLHISENGDNLYKLGAIRNNQGVKWNRNPEAFYPIPPNTRDYPHFAFVVDDSISGAGKSKMIYAATESDLEKQMTQIKSVDPTLKVLTKKDAENWYKSVGQYDYERTLTDVSFDQGLQRKGISSPYLVATDPQKILDDTLNWHLARKSNLVREAVLHQNEAQVDTLRVLGEKYTNVADSHFTNISPLQYLESQGKNPYADYVRTMLGLSTSKEFPFWSPVNQMLDRKVSELFNNVYESFRTMKSPAELESINKSLFDAGYTGSAYDAMTNAFANHTAPNGALTSFIAKANALLATTILRLDPINALNNVIGSNVLLGSETKSLIKAITAANSDAAGELAALSKLKVPGTEDSVFSAGKLISNSIAKFHSSPELLAEYKSRGFVSSVSDQYKWVLDNLALTGKETAPELEGKISKVFSGLKSLADKGERLTGNRLAEEFNRFVAADVMKQITDVGVKHGVISEAESWGYVNTFVNRTQGNYIASQRPGVFQGPLGQAIGLFQTYQFNLIQQLLRHVGEGATKDAATMLGLQASIYGMKGLPAFDAINTHIVGNASGNTSHRDLYDSVYGAVGKEAGDWLMYGLGSNALGLISPDLKFNLYTRGDINPRQVSVLPINPADVPFVQASGKMFASLSKSVQSVAQGGNVWQSMLQGIEHSGVNRPLAGLAQTLEAFGNPKMQSYSTSNKGNVQAANDFLSLANFTRIAGAKPLDEAIAVDRAFNLSVYAAKDVALRERLGESIKTTVIGGNSPSQEQVDKFSELYAKFGGKQQHFNQFMLQQYKEANTSQVNQLAAKLNSPFAQSMQGIMGGTSMRDFKSISTVGGIE